MDFKIFKDVRVAVAMISRSKKRANSSGQTAMMPESKEVVAKLANTVIDVRIMKGLIVKPIHSMGFRMRGGSSTVRLG